MDLYVTLPKLSVVDLRADTKPEMRLMLGSMSDVDGAAGSGVDTASSNRGVNGASHAEGPTSPQLTMLVMDMRLKRDSQAIMIRVQRPRLLVVVDFLIAIGEFFVPSLGSITGRDEAMDVSNDPVTQRDFLRLQSAYYLQSEDLVSLSTDRQLVADAYDIDEFVYDGGGHSLLLDIQEDLTSDSQWELEPMIFIGCNKHLRFKNIHIKVGLICLSNLILNPISPAFRRSLLCS
jgi:vacuolar protein sorting-associated protein 13A/C